MSVKGEEENSKWLHETVRLLKKKVWLVVVDV